VIARGLQPQIYKIRCGKIRIGFVENSARDLGTSLAEISTHEGKIQTGMKGFVVQGLL
jgi:hypothetical protein